MANGKPGDDPLTDILLHQLDLFSPTIDALIREIALLGGEKELEDRFDFLAPPPLEEFETELRAIRDRLWKEAEERGWEVDSGGGK